MPSREKRTNAPAATTGPGENKQSTTASTVEVHPKATTGVRVSGFAGIICGTIIGHRTMRHRGKPAATGNIRAHWSLQWGETWHPFLFAYAQTLASRRTRVLQRRRSAQI
jgi:hypothetical protein